MYNIPNPLSVTASYYLFVRCIYFGVYQRVLAVKENCSMKIKSFIVALDWAFLEEKYQMW